jgi:hypothetical protein
MLAEMELLEYAEEVQREVCGHCPERRRAEGRSKINRVDPSLHGLIGWIVKVSQRFVGTSAAGDWPECEGCSRPSDFLAELFAQVVKDSGQTDEQWECCRRRAHRSTPKRGKTIRELYQAYEETTGTVIGCD